MNKLIIPLILILGTGFLWKSLSFYFQRKVVVITLVLLVFATNLFFVGVFSDLLQPSLLFLFYSILIFLTISWHRKPSLRMMVFLGLITSLIVMVQPTGYFVFLIPLLWKEDKMAGKEKVRFLRQNPLHLILFLLVLVSIILVIHFTSKSMPGEIPFLNLKLPGLFIFGSRFLWNNLFSFNHGWIIYSPVLIIPAIGFYFLAEKKKELFLPLFLFCVLDLLAESCWNKLGNTPVFGQTAFVELYPLLAFPTAFFIDRILERGIIFRWISVLIIFLFLFLNLFQIWQFQEGILPSSGTTSEIYGMVFCRTNLTKNEYWRILDVTNIDTDLSGILKTMTRKRLVEYDFEQANPPNPGHLVLANSKFGGKTLRMDTTLKYSPGIFVLYSDLLTEPRGIVRITADLYSKEPVSPGNVFLVITSTHNQKAYRYRMSDITNSVFAEGHWQTISFDYITPVAIEPGDMLQAYVYCPGHQAFLVDNIQFDLFE